MSTKNPDYILKVKPRGEFQNVVGRAWSNSNGTFSIQLNTGVRLDWKDDVYILLAPKKKGKGEEIESESEFADRLAWKRGVSRGRVILNAIFAYKRKAKKKHREVWYMILSKIGYSDMMFKTKECAEMWKPSAADRVVRVLIQETEI